MSRMLGLMASTEVHEPPDLGVGDNGEVSTAAVDYILQAGRQAPSGDNAQPWRFAAEGNRVHVYLDPDADRSFFNVEQMASITSCGAVVENIVIAAGGCGLSAEVSPLPDGNRSDLMATVDLSPAEDTPGPLHDALWHRHTNRTMYDKRPLMDAAVDAVMAASDGFEGAKLHLLRDKRELKRLADIVRRADLLRVSHRGLHEHFHSMVRRSEAEADTTGDGFPLGNLEAGFVGEVFLKLSRPWGVMNVLNRIGMGRVFASAAARGLYHCSAAALLTVEGTGRLDFLQGGRALERTWLTVTDLGLDMQPMTAITLFWLRCQLEGEESFAKPHRRLLRTLWDDYRALFPGVDFERHGQVMLFRLGYGRPMKIRTRRKPLESFNASQ
jgi:nitroreductase